MIKHFDHLTIVVQDVERAKKFFGLLGFKESKSVVIAGEPFASYMGVPDIKADHITLVLENASPRTEIQLLRYQHPSPLSDAHIRDLHKIGMNHICFAVEDVAAEVAKLRANGFKTRNERGWRSMPCRLFETAVASPHGGVFWLWFSGR
jgi:catechol 2,3-dioxygenase-like lactoylglutathione lyase family enzyme